jgi:hypothetical protein
MDWWRAWAVIAVIFAAELAIAVNVLAHGEALLNERLKSPFSEGTAAGG